MEQKPVEFLCDRYKNLAVVVRSERSVLDEHGKPIVFPGKTVYFRAGIYRTSDPEEIAAIENCTFKSKITVITAEEKEKIQRRAKKEAEIEARVRKEVEEEEARGTGNTEGAPIEESAIVPPPIETRRPGRPSLRR